MTNPTEYPMTEAERMAWRLYVLAASLGLWGLILWAVFG